MYKNVISSLSSSSSSHSYLILEKQPPRPESRLHIMDFFFLPPLPPSVEGAITSTDIKEVCTAPQGCQGSSIKVNHFPGQALKQGTSNSQELPPQQLYPHEG